VSIPAQQSEVAAFLRRQCCRDPIETHISLVFVGTDTVWKLKKAVQLAFLDFTRIEDRRRFAERELALNTGAAPGLYRDVVPITRQPDGSLALGGPEDAPVVDWVVRMARIPADDFLDVVAMQGRLDPKLLDAIGDAVATAHQGLSRVDGLVPDMERVANGNARAAREAGLPTDRIEAWRQSILTAIALRRAWFIERAQAGYVRRAHGDLHLGNLCLWHGEPALFDALEFDEALATIDLGYDLSFLLMDLDRRVGRAAANRVFNRYVARTGDAALVRGLPVFLSMRAMIRAHVEARSGRSERAEAYLAAALGYLAQTGGIVVAVGGLPGTGKTTLARALAPALGAAPGALVLRSDEIRKRRFGVLPEQRLPPAAYTEEVSKSVFLELAAMAGTAATAGHAVLADGTFMDLEHRRLIEAAASRASCPFHGFWLVAPLSVLEARVERRVGDASDATVDTVRAAAGRDPGPGTWQILDACDINQAWDLATTALRPHLVMREERRPELHRMGTTPTGADHGHS